MKIDIPFAQENMSDGQLTAYLNTLREMILYVADQMNKPEPEEEE